MITTSDDSIRSLIPELIATRRDLHQYPELGYKEKRTCKKVADRLEELGFEVRRDVAKTGVIGLWRGEVPEGEKATTIAFRADLDALPLEELSDHDYMSRNPGVMHACGHDGHTAILLAFARWLSERKEKLPGHVKLLFQPAEEGLGGAEPMIRQGALRDPDVNCIFGLHLWNPLPVGTIGVRPGPMMASADEFTVTVKGRGGHGAIPQQAVDAVVVASHIVTLLQTIVSRSIDPLKPAVITVGKLQAGSAHNIIAETATLVGTARAFDTDVRSAIPELIQRTANGVARAMGAEIDFDWRPQYPPTINDGRVTSFAKRISKELVGPENVLRPDPSMGAEDMSFYLNAVPGCFIFLGSSNKEKGLDKPHHNPYFNFDEDAMPIGVALFARITESFFEKNPLG